LFGSNDAQAEPLRRPAQALRITRYFGDIKIRPKLMVLHNLFFLVLTSAIYFTLIPPFESRVGAAREREFNLVNQMFSDERPLPSGADMSIYEFQRGTAAELGMPPGGARWLEEHPGATFSDPASSDYLYRKERSSGFYRRLKLPRTFYASIVSTAKWTLFVVLGLTYVLAVLLLELVIMPEYVYRPIRLLLDADVASQRGDRENELVDPQFILDDEIGQIIRSRNETIAKLRRHERALEEKNALLETAKRNLEQQDRLASLGLMSASIAHEMNTPLSVLHGSVEKLLETTKDTPTRERLERMLRVSRRMHSICESLLDFVRPRQHETKAVTLRPLIDESWALVGIDERAEQVRFRNQVSRDAVVIGNPDRLIQVFVNLLRNAMHAVQSGGNVTAVSSSGNRQDGKWITVSIEDDGPGIPSHVLPEIFEAFVTSRLDAKGTGLGLTVAEGIVHQHGGTIAASNRAEGGARLAVCLPAAVQEVRVDGR
jgi:signal transduction histidine kinase